MKVTYIKLKNVAGISVGSSMNEIEIDLTSSKNKIVSIQGRNGTGKTVLLSSLSPFAYTTSLDDRSTLSYITPHKDGEKIIHYQNGEDLYEIRHIYKATKDTHSVKSYISLNGESLNENGNVSSFLSTVELHLNLTPEMLRLSRLGSNVNSFITLTPARRKEYIGKLINEIDLYLKIYKKINDDIRVIKVLIASNTTNLHNCHIPDIILAKETKKNLQKLIKGLEKDKDELVSRLGTLESLQKGNDINALKGKKLEIETSIREFEQLEIDITNNGLANRSLDEMFELRNQLNSKLIDVKSNINSFKISIDNAYSSIDRLDASIKKITMDNDLTALRNEIHNLKQSISNTQLDIINFSHNVTSDQVQALISMMYTWNQIASTIYTFGNKPLDLYLKLRSNNSSIESFLKHQALNNLNRINKTDIGRLISKVYGNDSIIAPECESEYIECPYYKLSQLCHDIRDATENVYDDETLNYLNIISNNVDNIMNNIDRFMSIEYPGFCKDMLREDNILINLSKTTSLFDVNRVQSYLSIVKDSEIYREKKISLERCESQLVIYSKSGIDNYSEDIEKHKSDITSMNLEIDKLTSIMNIVISDISETESNLLSLTKYNETKKFKDTFISNLSEIDKILVPLESASSEMIDVQYKIRDKVNEINSTRDQFNELDSKILEFTRLSKEHSKLESTFKDMSIIMDSVSTKKGIPVIFMQSYLTQIKDMANKLLKLIYNDDLKISTFNVTQDSFEVPFKKNGVKIPDVKYGSQSEVALITMALSFALAIRSSDKYNILLLDEIDAGLDENNRSSFLKMLNMQMNTLNAEQVFIISHNLDTIANVPMDVIKLSETGANSPLQNIIYS